MKHTKYRITNDVIVTCGKVLHRIEALVDIQRFGVKVGDLGGYIERGENLSHDGDAWVGGNAQVYGDAWVGGNARVGGDAQVYGNAQVYGDAWVGGNARVCGNARVYEDAQVYGNARVCGYAQVYGDARVGEDAQVYGNAQVCGYAKIRRNGKIESVKDYCVFGPCGSRNDFTTFYKTETGIWVSCGCFNASIEKFLKKVEETHGDNKHGRIYRGLAELASMKLE